MPVLLNRCHIRLLSKPAACRSATDTSSRRGKFAFVFLTNIYNVAQKPNGEFDASDEEISASLLIESVPGGERRAVRLEHKGRVVRPGASTIYF